VPVGTKPECEGGPDVTERITHWIGGRPWAARPGRQGDVYDPATGVVSGRVDFASTADVDAAVASAEAAYPDWSVSSIATRTRVLFAFRELLAGARDELAEMIVREHGKVRDDALGEVARGLEVVEYACGVGPLLSGATAGYAAGASTGVDVYALAAPLGVVAVITPFNFPAMVPLWFAPLAIACGNTVVLKPSEKDPSAALLLARLWQRAGLPDGVFNVVHGDAVAVNRLLEHPVVRAVSFVGSTPVARHVYETATRAGKRVQALGGAKNHMVVLPDADLDQAADAAVSAGFGAAGERCMAISVVVAVEPVGDALVERIAARMAGITVGPGLRAESQMGPLITAAHRDKVAGYLEHGTADGATLVVDGRKHPVTAGSDDTSGGFWLGPTLFDHVEPGMAVYTDEIFGPVLSVVRAASFDAALELVNANPYANGAAVFTADGGAATRFRDQVDAGMVGVNVPIPVPVAYHSFGGAKTSLFGDTHAYGPHGVRFFTRTKTVTQRWPDPAHGGVNLGFPRNS
jgi:malonate-semialdehyde dehydrogenase (acetylating)/methylmalonate-semialdehyde dehydrogenase